MAGSKLARLFLGCALLLLVSLGWSQTPDCTSYNQTLGPFAYGSLDKQQHSSGTHQFANSAKGTCSYSGSGYDVTCSVTANATSTSGAGDTSGSVLALPSGYVHDGNFADKQGTASSNGSQVTADAEGAGAIRSCFASCSTSISIAGSGQGGGYSVGFSPSPLWSDARHFSATCQPKTTPQPPSCGTVPPPTGSPGAGCSWQFDATTCSYQDVCGPCQQSNCSPLIVDTNHGGFHFTDPKTECVLFDVTGTGVPVCVSWPEHGSGNAWLVYDRDGDGVIDSGKELFGNFSPHADADGQNTQSPNGFLALAWFDKNAQGGDFNLVIDKRDKVWTKLKLWIDDHCYKTPSAPCASVPGELFPLEQFGITSISLVYTGANGFTDTFNNQFRFSAVLNPDAETQPINAKGESCCDQHQHSSDGRLIYDVYLQAKQ